MNVREVIEQRYRLYLQANLTGDGHPFDTETADAHAECVYRAHTYHDVSIYQDGSGWLLVGTDGTGENAWAVPVGAEEPLSPEEPTP